MRKNRILVVVPAKPMMHSTLKSLCVTNASKLVGANQTIELALFLDFRAEPSEPTDSRPWSKVARVRNKILDSINLEQYDYLLWIDADVVEYPADMPTRLIQANPTGVSAPMILVERTDIFYDWAAFILKGRDEVEPMNRVQVEGRNIASHPPYWPVVPTTESVEMDCVGTITMVPIQIYKSGVRYADHPAFTDHYPICKAARENNTPVTVHRNIVAYHANLPNYGEAWH